MTPTAPLEPGLAVQMLAVATGFAVKPLHMAITAALLVRLRDAPGRGLRLLSLGLAAFLAGESACAVSFLAGGSVALDLVHDAGMVLFGALASWGAVVAAEERGLAIVGGQGPCALGGLCQRCGTHGPCAAVRTVRAGAAVLALVSALPLTGALAATDSVVRFFGRDVQYGRGILQAAVDLRVVPTLAVVAFALAIALLGTGRDGSRRAWPALFAGIGLGSFATFRFLLWGAFHDTPWWADFWEEATELAAALSIAWLLWVFRRQLGLARAVATAEPRAASR